jgi:hypothetical protein|tara:strand:- start:750 stop:1196 length:447 start_codon:yes stop_codon:yes gene_type:complete
MTETPQAPVSINHNIRVIHVVTGEHIICNFGQIREEVDGEQKFVAYQLLYPLTLSLSEAEGETFNVTYRRWNPYTPYEDHRINPTSVISAMPPAEDILKNYVSKLEEAGIDLSFLPNNGNDILGKTDGEPTQEPTSAATEGPVATSEG